MRSPKTQTGVAPVFATVTRRFSGSERDNDDGDASAENRIGERLGDVAEAMPAIMAKAMRVKMRSM